MSKKPKKQREYTVTYRATVNVSYVLTAGSPEAAYRLADDASWNDGEIDVDEIHAVTISYEDDKGQYVHVDEADLNLEDDEEM